MSVENTNSQEGVEILESKPVKYVDEKDPEKKEIDGIYTHKIYHLGRYVKFFNIKDFICSFDELNYCFDFS